MKVSKNITISVDCLMVIEQVMKKYKKNFSSAVDLVITQWVRMQQQIQEKRKELEELQESKDLEVRMEVFDKLAKAKVMKK